MGVSQWFLFTSEVRVHPSASLRSDLGPRRFKRAAVSAPPTTNASSDGSKTRTVVHLHGHAPFIQLGSRERATRAHSHEEMPHLLVLYRSLTKERPHYHSRKTSSDFSGV